ncbi:hypothetical protein X777_07113, partial [Ooceraea biroi]
YLHTSAEEASTHARTNTDEHARPIYSTALFFTASRHGSPFLATIVPFVRHSRASWSTTLSCAFAEKEAERISRERARSVSCRRSQVLRLRAKRLSGATPRSRR